MNDDNGDEQGQVGGGFAVELAQFGAPVLPTQCPFTDDELIKRIQRNEPIVSAQEYLARVKLEARALPQVVSASVTMTTTTDDRPVTKKQKRQSLNKNWSVPNKIPRVRDEVEKPKRAALRDAFEHARTTLAEWESQFIADETKRKRLRKVNFPQSLERVQWMEFCQQTPPLLHVLLQVDNVGAVRGIKHFTRALELGTVLDHPLASWVFALLARLDVPYTDDVAWTLKKLLRICASVEVWNLQTKEEEIHPVLVVRCLLEDFFGQADMDD